MYTRFHKACILFYFDFWWLFCRFLRLLQAKLTITNAQHTQYNTLNSCFCPARYCLHIAKAKVDQQENGRWNCMRCNLFHFVVNIFCTMWINDRCLKWLLSAMPSLWWLYVPGEWLWQVCAKFWNNDSSFLVCIWQFGSTCLTYWPLVERVNAWQMIYRNWKRPWHFDPGLIPMDPIHCPLFR